MAAEQLKNGCQALTLKKGYGFSYEVLTQGEFYGENAKIHVVPSYFWESEDGTIRKEVKLYHLGDFPQDAGKECYAWEGEPILLQYENYKVILQRFKGVGLVPADILCVAKDFPLEEYAKRTEEYAKYAETYRFGLLPVSLLMQCKGNFAFSASTSFASTSSC